MKAYHNDPTIKAKFQARLAEHRRLEHLTQGVGYATGTSPEQTKGCAVGCTLENYDHEQYPIQLGLPVWLAKLEDSLFEQLPTGEAEQFAEDFLEAIPVGADVEPVSHLLGVARIDKSLESLDGNKEPYADECRNALNLVKSWHLSQVSGPENQSAWSAAAWSVARSAWAAAESAESAAWAAAAWSAAWSADYIKWEATTLLSLLRASK